MTAFNFRKLIKLLSDIKNQLARIGIERDAEDEQPQPQPTPVVTINTALEIPIAIREYYESENKHKWSKRLKTLIEIGAVGVAVWLAVLNRGVLIELQKQTPKLVDSANASKSAAETASAALRMDQRAWVGITFQPLPRLRDGDPFAIPVKISNTGRTPARTVEILGLCEVTKTPEAVTLDKPNVRPRHAARLRLDTMPPADSVADFPIPCFEVNESTKFGIVPLTVTPAVQMLFNGGAGAITTVVHGRISYVDYFGKSHWVTFCHYVNGLPGGSDACFAYNDFDKDQ